MFSSDLIIFDCDGTLVDSEYLHNKVLADMLNELGLPQYDVAYTLENFAGRGLATVIAEVEGETGQKLPVTFLPDFIDRVIGNAPKWLKPVNGVQNVVKSCYERTNICVGSNGERPIVLSFLETVAIRPYFPDTAIFTVEMFANPKPAPDMFLHAANENGASPDRVLVVEDSVTGVRAAKAAGMKVIGLTGTYHNKTAHADVLKKAGADLVTEDLADILNYL